jgi:hypothetical protein
MVGGTDIVAMVTLFRLSLVLTTGAILKCLRELVRFEDILSF